MNFCQTFWPGWALKNIANTKTARADETAAGLLQILQGDAVKELLAIYKQHGKHRMAQGLEKNLFMFQNPKRAALKKLELLNS